jgi:two-component system, OmpR family, phosphate regulon sensor histidine kinase PhoR
MKSLTIRLIIISSAIALLGLITTQTFWITKAINISQKNIEHRIHSALGSTVNEIAKSGKSESQKCSKFKGDSILILVKPRVLDSLLMKYLSFLKVDTCYEFALIKSHGDSIVYSTKGFRQNASNEKYFKQCLSCIYDKEHYHIKIFFPKLQKTMFSEIFGWLLLSVLFLVVIIFCFGFIVFAVFQQKKISEMKTDFINNMSHEFKTPLSTISLASEILINSGNENNHDKINRYAKIIYEENERMRSQVEQVLRMSQLDQGEYEITKEEVDIHDLIQSAVNNLFLEENDNGVKVTYHLDAAKTLVMADPIHITNVINNLLENAYKYSVKEPNIEIFTVNSDSGIIISVKDNGIGISSDKQKYIFEKFYRVPTGDIHDVKGTGIGLYYVKVILEAHSGWIKIKSEPGNGSRFEIFLPFN